MRCERSGRHQVALLWTAAEHFISSFVTLRGVWRTSSRAGKHTEHVQSVQEGGGKDLASLLLFIYGFFLFFFFVLFLMLYFSCCDTAWRSRKLRSEGAVCLEPGTKAIRLLLATGLVHSMGNLGVSRKKKKNPPSPPLSPSSVPVLLAGPSTVISHVDACVWRLTAALKRCPL